MTPTVPMFVFAMLLAAPRAQEVAERLAAACAARETAGGPGFAALVAQGGTVLLRTAHGLADLDTRAALRPDQPFYVASVAKSFTAACVVHLARTGKLDLDDDVAKFVPDLPAHCRGITLRHLMHHRSGLRDFYEIEWLAGRDPMALTTPNVLAVVRRQRSLNFAPGSDFLYSNTGYLLLAEVVERCSGKTLREYADEHLCTPLSLSATRFRDATRPEVAGVPLAYDDGNPSLQPPLLCGAGGLFSNVDDLNRWLTALTGGTWQDAVTRELLQPPQLEPQQRRSPQFNPYAGGLFVKPIDGRPAVVLLGGFGGWQAAAIAFPQLRLHVVVLANGDADAFGLARELADVVAPAAAKEPPAKAAKPGLTVFRAADGELLFLATRRNGQTMCTTLGWKVEVAERDGAWHSLDAGIALAAHRTEGGALEVQIEGERTRSYAPFAMQPATAEDGAALAGVWHGDEVGGDVRLLAEGGRLRLDGKRILPIAPFQPLDRDTWASDTGMQIDVVRDAEGAPVRLRISTARARGLEFTRP